MIHYFDRSRMETDHKCPRNLWWEYYFDGKGLQPVRINQHLAFGSAVHEALAYILSHAADLDILPDMVWVSKAIGQAQANMREAFDKAKGFQAEPTTELDFEGNVIGRACVGKECRSRW